MLRKHTFALLSLLWIWSGCTYELQIKDGTSAYERKQFAKAIELLPREYNQAKDAAEKGKKAYMLAESYRRTSDPASAADWYDKAIRERYGADAAIRYAQMRQQLQQYDDAAKAYQSAGRDEGDQNKYRQYVIACRKAKEWLAKADSNEYKIKSLDFNTPDTDFSPVLLETDRLLFSSDRQDSEGKEVYKWTGDKFFDFYTLNIKENKVERYEVPFNKDFHQGTVSFNSDKTEAYLTQCGSKNKVEVDYCKICRVRKEGDTWGAAEELDFGAPTTNFIHPHLALDGKMLIFAANNSAGFGGYDLYYSLWLNTEKRWNTPTNMGASINTNGNEVFPFLHNDTLYFASDGHPGMGGLDLFRIERFHDRWQNLKNLQAPMNSGGDDFGLIVDENAPKPDSILLVGYFTSNRMGGKGSDDIYQFRREVPKIAPPVVAVDTPKIVFRLRLEGLVKETVYKIAGNPNSGIADARPLLGASVQVSTEDTVFTVGSEADGSFRFELERETDYTLRASKQGYFNQIKTLTTKGIELTEAEPEKTLTVELILDKIFTNQEIVLENIYYDYDKWDIRDDAKPTLDSLTQILIHNPTIKIQLASHTDCRGADSYNEELSSKRAESAVRYLVQKGIVQERLQAKGYGETKPANDCKCSKCTEEEHQGNRRTTFMVLE